VAGRAGERDQRENKKHEKNRRGGYIKVKLAERGTVPENELPRLRRGKRHLKKLELPTTP